MPGAQLRAVLTRHPETVPAPYAVGDVHDLVDGADVVLEAAGHEALAAHGPAIIEAGCDLLAVSVGALVDPVLLAVLDAGGPGRLLLTSGAIGGLDLLQAAARAGASTAGRADHDETVVRVGAIVDGRRRTRTPVRHRAGRGVPRHRDQAARRFPRSLNVVAAVALAVGSWDVVDVTLIGDA